MSNSNRIASGSEDDLPPPPASGSTTAIRLKTCIAIVATISLGLATKFYRGFGSDWVNNFGPASVCYVVLVVLIFFVLHPRRRFAFHYAALAFILTCAVEFTQLIDIEWLNQIRSQMFWKLVLGTTFTWWDFPAYLVGAIVGWAGIRYGVSPSAPEKTNNSPRPDSR